MADRSRIYDGEFFARIRGRSYQAAQVILPNVLDTFPYQSVIDVGGGTGSWSLVASELGVKVINLIDGDHVDANSLLVPKNCFSPRDLQYRFSLSESAELAICMEVAEHLPPKRAPEFVEDLCKLSKNILFSAAIPYQGGDGHVNEMWPEYWADLFEKCGYDTFDFIRPKIWNDRRVDWWYRQNVLFFSARQESPGVRHVGGCPPRSSGQPLTRIHPEAYISLARRPRPDKFRERAARDVEIYGDSSKRGKLGRLGYGGEFDSVPRPELVDISRVGLRGVIVGPGRTGSTALADALSRHRDVFCLNETQDLPLMRAKFGTCSVSTSELIETLLSVKFSSQVIIADQNAGRAGKGAANFRTYLDRLSEAFPKMDVLNFQRYVQSYFLSVSGRRLLIDKTPDYAHHLDLLLDLWPDLRIVLMLRDPAPTVLSMRNHDGDQMLAARQAASWAGLLASEAEVAVPNRSRLTDEAPAPEDFSAYLDIWCNRVEAALDFGTRLDSTQFMVLHYEELCRRPAEEGRRLLRFLGVDPNEEWISQLVEDYRNSSSKVTESFKSASDASASHKRVMRLLGRIKKY